MLHHVIFVTSQLAVKGGRSKNIPSLQHSPWKKNPGWQGGYLSSWQGIAQFSGAKSLVFGEIPLFGSFWWYSGWWFQIFFIFNPIWGRFPFWLIFFRWIETTNQHWSRAEIHSTVGQPSGEIDGEMLEMKKETVEMREKQVMGKFHPEFQ